jgi:FixJ family two-component response regulator/anti-sigma regulatory factor (Ser/Thr protein kinase)
MPRQHQPPCVLIVDDDDTSLLLMRSHLERRHYRVVQAHSVASAQAALLSQGCADFAAVVSDYRMPAANGIELIDWLAEQDASLGTIMVTAEAERSLITQSLRSGVVDFVEKPIAGREFAAAVERAVGTTRRRRELRAAESAVHDIARVQKTMLALQTQAFGGRVDLSYKPRQDAGGDFASVCPLSATRFVLLVSDVSGHDPKAAFVASYFQGVVRGMVERATPVDEVFAFFNRLLLAEWSRPNEWAPSSRIETSVSACAIDVDLAALTLATINCGIPRPVVIDAEGVAGYVQGETQAALGWFEDTPLRTTRQSLPGGRICLWTDGLTDIAAHLDVDPLAVVADLALRRETRADAPYLRQAHDDVMAVIVHTGAEVPASAVQVDHLILFQELAAAEAAAIDRQQDSWRRTLTFAVQEISGEALYRILLATREAVLNALTHGCGADPADRARLQMTWMPVTHRLVVRVADPGPGHTGWDGALNRDAEFGEAHRGLALMRACATRVVHERRGAVLRLEFALGVSSS